MAELVDALDLGSRVPLDVEVRVFSAAQTPVFLRQMGLNRGSFGVSSGLGQELHRPQTTVKNRKEMYFLPDTELDTEHAGLPGGGRQNNGGGVTLQGSNGFNPYRGGKIGENFEKMKFGAKFSWLSLAWRLVRMTYG